ncbi:hypothetical protein QCA50_009560 [Cerrena zonata]|uniref:DNA ligase n=1 Tax=Cerrena zonata TaxID=2478898 RepID=A0AAW0G0S0_9APHY
MKRSLTTVGKPSTPRKKKAKVETSHQSSLDTFFGSPGQKRPGASSGKGKAKLSAGITPVVSELTALERDEAYARALAEQDGLTPEVLLNLEQRASQKAAIPTMSGQPEVIDVDLLDDDDEQPVAGPSKPYTAGTSLLGKPSSSTSSQPPSRKITKPPFSNEIATKSAPTYIPLSIDPTAYDLDGLDWSPNAPIPYSFLTHTLSSFSETRSRIAILNTLTNCLRSISRYHPPSLLPSLYLLSNSLSPPYSPLELGLGHAIISKAIQQVSGLTSAALKRLYTTTGDPGDVAYEAKSNVRTLIPHPPLLITGVYDSLLKIARAQGQGATKQKQAIVEKLLVAARGEEIRYLVRTLCQNLRVGAVRTSILTALSRAMVLTPPSLLSEGIPDTSPFRISPELLSTVKPLPSNSKKKTSDTARDELNEIFTKAEALIKKIYVQRPNYDHLASALLEAALDGLTERLPLTVGIPLLPTLGSPTRSLDEIYDRLGLLPFAAEFKYDGQRAQIHATRTEGQSLKIKLFSRHLEDMTDKYPDVCTLVNTILLQSPNVQSFIIDSEIVAVDPNDGSLKTFQELSNRARKDVQLGEVKVSVCVFAFDLMYLNGEILLEKAFRERRTLLRSQLPPIIPTQKGAARFDHVQSCESEDGREAVEEFWQMAVNSRTEGLMIKLLDSGEVLQEPTAGKDKIRRKPLPATYEPDKRTSAWLKLKKDYVIGLGDSLDLVPIGAWHGNGRKANWWSPILLALWDPDAGKLVAVCKCMSGFTDVFYKGLNERYPLGSDTCAQEPCWDLECDTGGLRPEVYFKPQEVWEIRGADVTISPVSKAAFGLVSKTRGLSLRFPRFIKVREDKGIENASTPQFLANMWESQQGQGKDRGGVDEGELVDVIEVGETDIEEELSE